MIWSLVSSSRHEQFAAFHTIGLGRGQLLQCSKLIAYTSARARDSRDTNPVPPLLG
jgi:hypothetical protein